jgi:formylglycine-generating enzyme required for sulfatase activity/CheY-like chemotaxis protein
MKILVVDREEDLPVAVAILESAPGNEVQSVTTGPQALEMTDGGEIDLLITEVFMEPMNGFTLRNKLENRHRGMRTIFLTGYDLAPYAEHTAGYEIVTKPATPQKLLPAIARATVGMVKKAEPAAVIEPPAAEPAPPKPVPVAETKPAVPVKSAPPAAKTQPIRSEPAPRPPDEKAPPAFVKGFNAEAIASEEEFVEAAQVPEPSPEPPRPIVSEPPVVEAKAPEPVAPLASELPRVPKPIPAPAPVSVPAPLAAEPPKIAVPIKQPEPPAPPAQAAAPAVQTTLPPPEPVPAEPPEPEPSPVPEPVVQAAAPAPASSAAQAATSGKGVPIVLPPKPTADEAAKIAMKVSAATLPKTTPEATAPPIVTAAAPAPSVPPLSRPQVKSATANDPMLSKTLGNYRIERRLGNGHWGPVYLAIQTSMNREVALEMLAPERIGDIKAREAFTATSRAKAGVQHPHILSVYEADEAEGYLFYTHEYVDGLTLAQMVVKGQTVTDHVAVQMIKAISQALAHLHQHGIAHSIPEATDIYLGKDGLPYVSNVAQPGKEMPPVQEEICTMAEVIRTVLPHGDAGETGLRSMLTRMAITNQMGFQSWPPLFQAIQEIEPKVVPLDAFKLSAQDEAAIRAVEQARKKQRNAIISSLVSLIVLLGVLGGVVYFEFLRPISHDYSDEVVKIGEGEFIYQDGQKITLPTYYIDKYEVTMGEYGKFLQYWKEHDYTTEYDSPLQPKGLDHTPKDWDLYYGRAAAALAKWRYVKGVPISLDCPAFNVTYFDAYAYAKWKGRRLPTQEEWEKAARGPYGNLYPWGNVWDPTKLNAGTDYQVMPPEGYKATVDGFNWWNPVDAILTDKSYYGVIGMAGNVSEWTDSWDASKTYVYIRGGNYKSNSAQAMLTTQIKAYPQVFAETLGFRTVSDTPPAGK